MTSIKKQYQEIAITDWRELKVGDTIKYGYYGSDVQVTIIEIDKSDNNRPFLVEFDNGSKGWRNWPDLRNIRKLVEIPHQPTQQPQTMNYSQEILNVIKSKNAWVIAKVHPNGQLDFSIPQSMVNSEAEVKGKIEQLAKTYPGVIFTSFKMQHAVRVNQPELIVR